MENTLRFGWAEVDITPDKKASLCGQFAERISQFVEKPLTATALAIDSGDDHAVMVSADLVGVSFNLVAAIRQRLQGNTLGLDPMKVIFAATHTHTAPGYPRLIRTASTTGLSNGFRVLLEKELPPGRRYVESANVSNNPEIISQEEMFDLLLNRLEQVVMEAWKNRAPGACTNAFGRAVVGMCRRAAYSDGSAQMWGDTNTAVFTELEGGNDSGIELMYFFREDGKLSGILANLACPAQCVQHRHFISPDFWGEVRVLLRQHFGEEIFLLAQCSAAGDQCPVDLIRWVEPETDVNDPNLKRSNPPKRKADPSMFDLAGMRKTGKRIAREIIDIYEEGLDEARGDLPFAHQVHMLQLPLRRVKLNEIASAKKAIREYIREKNSDVDFNDAAALQVHLGLLVRAELQELMDILDTEVHIIRMGNVAFASNPFELFLDYGNQIKARSPAEQTFLIQLANGCEGYLPTKKAEDGGHYSAFVSSGTVGHTGGEQLVRQTLKQLRELF